MCVDGCGPSVHMWACVCMCVHAWACVCMRGHVYGEWMYVMGVWYIYSRTSE